MACGGGVVQAVRPQCGQLVAGACAASIGAVSPSTANSANLSLVTKGNVILLTLQGAHFPRINVWPTPTRGTVISPAEGAYLLRSITAVTSVKLQNSDRFQHKELAALNELPNKANLSKFS